MARPPRCAAPGVPQHVIQRGNDRSRVFACDADYRFYHTCLLDACEEHACQVHAYVFMTNHTHLLITPTSVDGVSRAMQSVGRRYVRRFNTSHKRTGTLWEGRYKATLVDSDRYLFACHRYIELNPVRAALVRGVRDYRWSSHRANAFGARDRLVTPHEQYLALGANPSSRQTVYRTFFAAEVEDSMLDVIRDATNKGWVLGDKAFRDDVAARLARRTIWSGRRNADARMPTFAGDLEQQSDVVPQ